MLILYSFLKFCSSYIHFSKDLKVWLGRIIQLLESPIPTAAPVRPSQKASSGDISGTKRGIIDPLVSKRPENILNKKIQNKKKMLKMVKNGQKWSKMVKMVNMV